MMENLQNFYQEHKAICLLVPVCLFAFLFSLLVLPNSNQMDAKKPYVYTKEQSLYQNQIDSYLPYINLKGNDAKELNEELQELFEDNENTLLTYSYDVSGDYLSLVYCIIDVSEELPAYEMKAVVFSIPQKRKLKTNEILQLYGTTEGKIRNEIEGNMQAYYNEMTSKGYIEANECSYTCFLNDRHFDEEKELELGIQEGNLYAYQSFVIDGMYGEAEFFTTDHFKFFIANPR